MENPLDHESIDEIKKALENNDQALAVSKIKEYLEKETNTPLHIGVTGESGSGKSSFVNAFRGIDDMDELAAPTGCVETTTVVTPYPHPNYPNVTLWDLPGIGTTKFPAQKYMQHVGFEKFDFFIIISATRFRENDVKLAKEIQKMGKKFYFVRSKIDNDLQAAQRSQRQFDAEKTLTLMRDNCIRGLNKHVKSPQVFLVSRFDLQLYDFRRLCETWEKELPQHKRRALLLAMPNISQEIINKKKKAFQDNIKYFALISAAGAAVPLPGLSVALDLSVLVGAVKQYMLGFGLDGNSLKRLAGTTRVPLDDLTATIKSPLALQNITPGLILRLLLQCSLIAASMAAEEGLRFIPILGTIVAAPISYVVTAKALETFLNMLADDAQRVFRKALGLNTSVSDPPITISSDAVRMELSRLHSSKSAGPDGLSPKFLKGCAAQLCDAFQHIFQLSLSIMVVPALWKTTCLVPVPKTSHPNSHSDYIPVALTSHAMKSLERLVLKHVRSVVEPYLDPLQQ
uniref:interferon-inducible GTPase 5-like n=1 Tax=Scatophagus argus TaxID=75038 RepID=UPI001ED8468B|nr:interferon-inducible GTPase 5-like [Scatophagus argus]